MSKCLLYSGKPKTEIAFFTCFILFYSNVIALVPLANMRHPLIWVSLTAVVIFGIVFFYLSTLIDSCNSGGSCGH